MHDNNETRLAKFRRRILFMLHSPYIPMYTLVAAALALGMMHMCSQVK